MHPCHFPSFLHFIPLSGCKQERKRGDLGGVPLLNFFEDNRLGGAGSHLSSLTREKEEPYEVE